MKPRAAPTQMKTVPSGRLDFCMKGAAAVSGTPMVGMPAPAIVGRPVRWKTEREPVVLEIGGPLVTEKDSMEALELSAEDAELAAEAEAADDAAVVFAAALDLPASDVFAATDVALLPFPSG